MTNTNNITLEEPAAQTTPHVLNCNPPIQPALIFFPLINGTKEPACKWRDVKPKQYEPIGNYGIALTVDLIVLDFDPRNYPIGRDLFSEFFNRFSGIHTRIVKTPRGGYHVYFKKPAENKIAVHQPAWPGIDFLSDGHYICGPGTTTVESRNSAAGTYELLGETPIAALPIELLSELLEPKARSSNEADFETLSGLQDFISLCRSYPEAIDGQYGDRTTFLLACIGFDLGLPEIEVLNVMSEIYNPRCNPPWSYIVLQQKVANARKYRQNPTGIDSKEMKEIRADKVWEPYLPDSQVNLIEASTTNGAESKPEMAELRERIKAAGFLMKAEGLFRQKTSKKQDSEEPESYYVCGPVAVVAETFAHSNETEGCFLVVRLCTRAGEWKQSLLPLTLLSRKGKDTAAEKLRGLGFNIEPGREEDVVVYLSRCKPTVRKRAAKEVGWLLSSDQDTHPSFALPNKESDTYIFVGETPLKHSMISAGFLTDWVENVWRLLAGNHFGLYEVLKALAAPLYALSATAEPMGENIGGQSSIGKTTLLQILASVWGCAAPPSKSNRNSFVLSWNGTANAMLAKVADYNCLPCPLDDVGTNGNGDDFGKLTYQIYSGEERSRCQQDGTLKERRTFQTCVTSSGEISIKNMIESNQSGKKNIAKSGQLIRFTDRFLKASPFENGAEAQRIKEACSRYYGTLGPAFLQALCKLTERNLRIHVEHLFAESMKRLEAKFMNGQPAQARALQRFAMAEAAGKLLIESKLIPSFSETELQAAIDTVAGAWAVDSHLIDDMERAIIAIRDYYLQNRDSNFKNYTRRLRFQTSADGNQAEVLTSEERRFRSLAGEVDEPNGRFYLYPAMLAEITGRDSREVARELDSRGLLVREPGRKGKRLIGRASVDGRTVSVYWISLKLIESELEWDDVI